MTSISIDNQKHTMSREQLRAAVAALCARFPDEYWRELDLARKYPQSFVDALTEAGYLAALIPTEYGGPGLGICDASVILEEINRSGGNSAACHAQIYTLAALIRHGSDEQKRRYLPGLASGELRMQAFSITEEHSGSDTTRIRTRAVREGSGYVISGEKSWTSRIDQSDLLLVLARTADRVDGDRRANGLSLFLVDLREVRQNQPETLHVDPVRTMFNYATNRVTYRDMWVPLDALVGEEGAGFRYVIDGWNAERVLLAAEAIGDGYWFVEKATSYANSVQRFGRTLAAHQGVQFPIAAAYAKVRAADLVRLDAGERFDRGDSCGVEANMAKLLASEASWEAANVALDTLGGFGFVDTYDIERKFRETRLYRVAPVSTNLVLAYIGTKALGMPKSY